jgi:hypothetical protein
MNKIKLLALFALSAMFFACGSQDGSAPSLKKAQLGFISPFDTLKVEFDSEIVNIDKLDASNLSTSTNLNILFDGKKSSKTLSLIGGNTTPGGSQYFDDGLEGALITFRSLENSDGYKRDSTVASFSTYRILDAEPNNNEATASNIDLFLTNTAKEITFAGVIDKVIGVDPNTGYNIIDIDDFYEVNLKFGDIISITASNRTTPFKVEFYSTCVNESRGCNEKSVDITQKNAVLQDTIKGGHLGQEGFETPVPFYIKISDGDITAKSNPYLITVKIR